MISSKQLIRTVKASRFTIEEAITKLAATGTGGCDGKGYDIVSEDDKSSVRLDFHADNNSSPQGSLLTLNAVETTVIDTIAASAGGMISSKQLIRTAKASRRVLER